MERCHEDCLVSEIVSVILLIYVRRRSLVTSTKTIYQLPVDSENAINY